MDVDGDDGSDVAGVKERKQKVIASKVKKVKVLEQDGWIGGDDGGIENGKGKRAQSYMEDSSPDESESERGGSDRRDGFGEGQSHSRGGLLDLDPSGSRLAPSIYDVGGNLPPSMALHPAWPLLPNNTTIASGPDEEGNPSMSTFPWDTSGVVGDGRGRSTPQAVVESAGTLAEFLESLGIPNLPGGIGDIFGMSTNRFQGVTPDASGLPFISNTTTPALVPRSLGANSAHSGGGGSGDPMVIGMRNFGDGNDAIRNPPLFTAKEQEEDIKPVLGAFGELIDELDPSLEDRSRARVDYMDTGEPLLGKVSKAEKYLLAAADQASGTRDERLAQVIKAKYDAGLLKPYDYSRSYARFYRWMEKK